jgi:hypothetical protein
MTTWWVSAVIGVLFTDIPGRFVGPPADLANGVGISLPLVVAAVLFLTLLRVRPEPRAGYGPEGRTVEVPVPPITRPAAMSVPSATLRA